MAGEASELDRYLKQLDEILALGKKKLESRKAIPKLLRDYLTKPVVSSGRPSARVPGPQPQSPPVPGGVTGVAAAAVASGLVQVKPGLMEAKPGVETSSESLEQCLSATSNESDFLSFLEASVSCPLAAPAAGGSRQKRKSRKRFSSRGSSTKRVRRHL